MKSLFIATIMLVAITQTQATELTHVDFEETTEKLIDQNLPKLAFTAPSHYNAQVKKMIIREITKGKHETEAALGRASLYFPIFEHFLRKYDLPEELKYIPYVETRIKARAVSQVGAGGLWQFMPYTARCYQLRTNQMVDDRYDPIRATEAAVRYLQDLYVEFDDWLLAIAAYNCGPGRVKYAIRHSKSKDFWKLERYLPTQTRHYVPMFIAAIYVGKFYKEHDLKPKKYIFNIKNVRILKIRQGVQLSDLARVIDLPINTIRLLNPAYKQSTLPAYQRGNYLILPAAALVNAQRYFAKINGRAAEEVKIIPLQPNARVSIDPSKDTQQELPKLPDTRQLQPPRKQEALAYKIEIAG